MSARGQKLIVLTGASSGIGYEVARGVLDSGALLVPILRDTAKSKAVIKRWRSEFNAAAIFPFFADLSALSEVRKAASAILDQFPKVDVLINNAGLQRFEYIQAPDGYELTWTVNFLAPVLLTHLLLPGLLRSRNGRIINTGSMVERWGHIEEAQGGQRFDGHQAYYRSKLALTMHGYALARRLHNTRVRVATFEPGMVRTEFSRNFKGFYHLAAIAFRPFMKSAHKAAQIPLDLALSPRPLPQAGYFRRDRRARSSQRSYDLVRQDSLYLQACAACGVTSYPPPAQREDT